MPRERKAKQWIKLDCEGMLHGSINYLFYNGKTENIEDKNIVSLACQAIWVKMLAFSEICGGRAGYIEDNNRNGLPHEYIAQELKCPLALFENVLNIMQGDGAININGSGSIYLVNFKHYQETEYDRQKVYRIKSGEGKQTLEDYVEALKPDYSDLDVDKEFQKFKLYWSESKKELKRPKFAFRNWLDNARTFNAKKQGIKKPSKFGDGW